MDTSRFKPGIFSQFTVDIEPLYKHIAQEKRVLVEEGTPLLHELKGVIRGIIEGHSVGSGEEPAVPSLMKVRRAQIVWTINAWRLNLPNRTLWITSYGSLAKMSTKEDVLISLPLTIRMVAEEFGSGSAERLRMLRECVEAARSIE